MWAILVRLLIGILSLLLAACSTGLERAQNKAAPQHYQHAFIQTKLFKLTSFYHLDPKTPQPVANVYIEGDGQAWISRYRLSNNPTPSEDLVLELALLDPSPNVIYLARPCQYTPLSDNKACVAKYWSSHRFAPEVLASMNAALNYFKSLDPKLKFNLIGYSGGGAIAALLAAKRSDINALVTLAGNLDHVAVNEHHGVTQMPQSLNAIDLAPKLGLLPQRHFVGQRDQIVPPFIAENFVATLGSRQCSDVVYLDVDHYQGWQALWPNWLQQPLLCSSAIA